MGLLALLHQTTKSATTRPLLKMQVSLVTSPLTRPLLRRAPLADITFATPRLLAGTRSEVPLQVLDDVKPVLKACQVLPVVLLHQGPWL